MSREAFEGEALAGALRERLGVDQLMTVRRPALLGRLNPHEVIVLRRYAQTVRPGPELDRVKRALELHPLDADQEARGKDRAAAAGLLDVTGLSESGRFQVLGILGKLSRAGL